MGEDNTISTHVLDTTRGRPAAGVPIRLDAREADGSFRLLASGTTDDDGRVRDISKGTAVLTPGVYRMAFDTEVYFAAQGIEGFYPAVEVLFQVRSTGEHYHVPLLISPFGFSTYRGS